MACNCNAVVIIHLKEPFNRLEAFANVTSILGLLRAPNMMEPRVPLAVLTLKPKLPWSLFKLVPETARGCCLDNVSPHSWKVSARLPASQRFDQVTAWVDTHVSRKHTDMDMQVKKPSHTYFTWLLWLFEINYMLDKHSDRILEFFPLHTQPVTQSPFIIMNQRHLTWCWSPSFHWNHW